MLFSRVVPNSKCLKVKPGGMYSEYYSLCPAYVLCNLLCLLYCINWLSWTAIVILMSTSCFQHFFPFSTVLCTVYGQIVLSVLCSHHLFCLFTGELRFSGPAGGRKLLRGNSVHQVREAAKSYFFSRRTTQRGGVSLPRRHKYVFIVATVKMDLYVVQGVRWRFQAAAA